MKITDAMIAEWQARKNTSIEWQFPHETWSAEVWGRGAAASIQPTISVYGRSKFSAIRRAIRAEAKEKK